LQGLVGTIGADPVHRPTRGRPGPAPESELESVATVY
jgi:hypothetical protein